MTTGADLKSTITRFGLFITICLLASTAFAAMATQEVDKLVYADFETSKDNRPVTNRGGLVQLFAYSENPANPSQFKGAAPASSAPEIVRLSKDDPNRAIAFEYQWQGPNQWAGVGVEVHGQANEDGKPVPDDVSGYKHLTLQLYVTGVSSITVEFISRGHGIEMQNGYPQMTFKVSPGFNTYKVALGSVGQPSWAEVKVKVKDVLKKLTSVHLSASCNQCTPVKGTVVIDNIIFQN